MGFLLKNSRYCQIHRKAYDNIKRRSMKGITELVLATDESRSFFQIFGDRHSEGDPCVANNVLLDYTERFPEGKETVPGKTRGVVTLVQYVHSRGSRQSVEDVTRRPKYDYEAFVSAMHVNRGWTPARCKVEWAKLRADPTTKSDQKGPPYDPTRPQLPSWMLCSDREEDRAGNLEERN